MKSLPVKIKVHLNPLRLLGGFPPGKGFSFKLLKQTSDISPFSLGSKLQKFQEKSISKKVILVYAAHEVWPCTPFALVRWQATTWTRQTFLFCFAVSTL